jgi:hypothetical protein
VLKETLILSKMLTYGAVSTFVEMLSTFGRPASAGDQRIVRAVLVEHQKGLIGLAIAAQWVKYILSE